MEPKCVWSYGRTHLHEWLVTKALTAGNELKRLVLEMNAFMLETKSWKTRVPSPYTCNLHLISTHVYTHHYVHDRRHGGGWGKGGGEGGGVT